MRDTSQRTGRTCRAIVLWVGGLLLGLSGCTAEVDTAPPVGAELEGGTDIFVTKPEMADEFREALTRITWPDGFDVPEERVLSELGPDDAYQLGYGDTIALELAFCAWEKRALDLRESDAERSAEALDQVELLTETPTFQENFDQESSVAAISSMLENARLGDWEQIRVDAEITCSYWLTGVKRLPKATS